jgi:hypothetical protein
VDVEAATEGTVRMAVRTDEGPPARDQRLALELLEVIARATEGGQLVNSRKLELSGWAPEQVWQELRLLWEQDLIRGTDTKVLSDPPA